MASIKQSVNSDGSAIVLEVRAGDSDGRIERVEFYVDHKLRYIDKSPPYRFEFLKGNEPFRTAETKVFDNKGARTVARNQ